MPTTHMMLVEGNSYFKRSLSDCSEHPARPRESDVTVDGSDVEGLADFGWSFQKNFTEGFGFFRRYLGAGCPFVET